MHAVVVYESMYGNTHVVAEAIGRGLSESFDVDVIPVDRATPALIEGVALLVVGGPTHAHGMSRATTRAGAAADAAKPGSGLTLDPDAEGEGLREWFDALDRLEVPAAAFDTRIHMPAVLGGRASKGIHRRLEHHGGRMITDPESFFVDPQNVLLAGEDERATEWGRSLAALLPHTANRT
jgi:hypothetical protein